jgi:NAD(P)H-dependent FMN reductase
VLKNALDFLYAEWNDKPVTCATYGTRGGSRGARQLREVFQGLHMRELADHLELVITEDDVDDEWQLKDVGATLRPYVEQIRAIDNQMTDEITGLSRLHSA